MRLRIIQLSKVIFNGIEPNEILLFDHIYGPTFQPISRIRSADTRSVAELLRPNAVLIGNKRRKGIFCALLAETCDFLLFRATGNLGLDSKIWFYSHGIMF